jgi:hypothetical protein
MKVTDKQITEAISTNLTMSQAAKFLGIHPSTLKARAIKLGVYTPNQGRKGIQRPEQIRDHTILLEEILQGLHPTYQTHKLRLRLIKMGIKKQQCEICHITHWEGQQLSLILDHINGINDDHRLENLRIVCPNCDSLLPTFCGRNKGVVRRTGFELV